MIQKHRFAGPIDIAQSEVRFQGPTVSKPKQIDRFKGFFSGIIDSPWQSAYPRVAVFAITNMDIANEVLDEDVELVVGTDVNTLFGVPEAAPAPPAAVAEDDKVDAITNPYNFLQALHFTKLAFKVRNLNDLKAIMTSVAYCIGEPHICPDNIADEIRSGGVRVPRRTNIQRWIAKCDWLCMLYDRHTLGHVHPVAVHGEADSSPQAGYNYLCSREDRKSLIRKTA